MKEKNPTSGFFLPHRPRALSCSGASSGFAAFGLAGGQQPATADAVPKNHGEISGGIPPLLPTPRELTTLKARPCQGLISWEKRHRGGAPKISNDNIQKENQRINTYQSFMFQSCFFNLVMTVEETQNNHKVC